MMEEVDINIPSDISLTWAEEVIEICCAREALRMTLKGTLNQYPESVHWHYKKGTGRGVLEITLWLAKPRIWFKIHAGRKGDGMRKTIPRLKSAIEDGLIFANSRL
jgi:hypothetical protein